MRRRCKSINRRTWNSLSRVRVCEKRQMFAIGFMVYLRPEQLKGFCNFLNVQNQVEWKFLWNSSNRKAFRNEIVADNLSFMREFEQMEMHFLFVLEMKLNIMSSGKKRLKWHLSLGLEKITFSRSWEISTLCKCSSWHRV
jgi:glycyl-tRNA synthetase (class II)